jgi:metallo-beta-lactamase class B
MKKVFLITMFLILSASGLFAINPVERVDKNIAFTRLTDKTYLIQSSYSSNGKLDCNLLLIIDTKDIVLVNTPTTDSLTIILLNCIEKKFKRKVTRVIVSHFHDDSAGGLTVTNRLGITSYGLDKTRDLLKLSNRKIDIIFSDSLKISLQTEEIQMFYFGAGHSMDNIVTWIPGERILFGGCLLKSLTATDKGNIKDADLKAWPVTVGKVKKRFMNAKIVIPGHSTIGDISIFDHTIKIAEMN